MKPTDTIRSILFVLICVLFTPRSAQAQMSYERHVDSAKYYAKKMNFQRALFHYQDALEISKKQNQNKRIIKDLLEIGSTYSNLDEYDKAVENRLEALKLAEKRDDADSLKYEALLSLSDLCLKRLDLDGAENYLNRVKLLAEQISQPYYLHRYYNNLGILERNRKNFDASINAYKKALEIARQEQFKIRYLNNLSLIHI